MPDFVTIIDLAALCADPETWVGALAAVREHAGVPAVLFLAGLVAGVTHCGGMCGPFVLTQIMSKNSGGSCFPGQLQRLQAAALIPYQMGRLTTYSALGVVTGGLAGTVADLAQVRWLLAGFLALASVYFVLAAVRMLGWFAPRARTRHAPFARVISTLCMQSVSYAGRLGTYPLGVALGFLPCGLIYGALAAAAGTGSAIAGGFSMAAFAVGTVPGLIMVGYGGSVLFGRFRIASQVAAIPLLVINIAIATAFAFTVLA